CPGAARPPPIHRVSSVDRPSGRNSPTADLPTHQTELMYSRRVRAAEELVSVRYMVDDVDEAVGFYTTHFGFAVRSSAAPAFADVVRGNLRLLLSGPASSAGRPMPDGRRPEPGGWNRIHFIVEDIAADVERLRAAGLTFRNDIVSGPGGRQILL